MDTFLYPQRSAQRKRIAKRKLTDEQIYQAYQKHLGGVPTPQLAQELKVTRGTLNKRFKLLNFKTLKLFQNTQHGFFQKIDSEIKAYLLGFIFGDGNVRKQGNTISIDVSIKDRYIVDLFNQLNPNIKPIERYKPNSHLIKVAITSILMKQDLLHKGVVPNKTYAGMVIQHVPKQFYRHLLRGFFDADGCIHKRQYGFQWFIVCSSYSFIQQLGLFLEEKGIKTQLQLVNKLNKLPLFHLTVYKKEHIIKLYELMYSGANYWLKRKRDIFIDNTEVIIEPKNLITP